MNDDIVDPKDEEEVDPLKTPIVGDDEEADGEVPADVVSIHDMEDEEEEDEDELEDLEADEM